MPIIFNGTTLNNGGGTKSFNGTALKKIKFGSTIVWQDQTNIYPGTTVQFKGSDTGTYGSFYVTVPNGVNYNSKVAYIPVSLSGLSTLTVTGTLFTAQVRTYAACALMTSTQFSEDHAAYPYYWATNEGWNESDLYTRRVIQVDGTLTNWTFNVSSLSGTYYLAIGCYVNNDYSAAQARATITQIIGV